MPRLPRIRGKDLVAALRRAGFQVVRISGSHHRMKHPDGRATTVPVHSREEIGPGLLGRILSDCEMTRADLSKFL